MTVHWQNSGKAVLREDRSGAVKDTKEEETQQLRKKAWQIEEEQERLEQNAKQVLQEEEDEDMELSRSYGRLQNIGRECPTGDKKMFQLLDEKEYLMRTFRKRKMEFDEQFYQEVKKQRQQMKDDREGLEQQMIQLKHKEEER